MRKNVVIIGSSIAIIIALAIMAWRPANMDVVTKPISEKQLAEAHRRLASASGDATLPPPVVLAPIDLSHPLRLAVGGLGLSDENENQKLGDLVTAQLSGAEGFDLVERQLLAAVLRELNLSWSGFVRAEYAVRAGILLKADWFLLGTQSKIGGKQTIVARLVDAHTGIMRDAAVFPADRPTTQLAADLASFLRDSRKNAAHPQPRVFLALGAFENVGVNDRHAGFSKELHAYLTAAYRGSTVTLLEREYVETLLQEIRLDLAGLTEDSFSNSPPAMQSAYWVVSGEYQSYETTNFQIELNLNIQRAFGRSWQRPLRALPGEPIEQQTKAAIDDLINHNSEYSYPTRRTEAGIQLARGRDLIQLHASDMISSQYWQELGERNTQFVERRKRKIEDAVRAFETVLLLEPTNRQAKVCLAMCCRSPDHLAIDEACDWYRQIIDDPITDPWSDTARKDLVETFLWFSANQKLRWLESAAVHTTNRTAVEFYQEQMAIAKKETALSSGDKQQVEAFAEERLFGRINSAIDSFHHKIGSSFRGTFGMDEYFEVYSDDPARGAAKLATLLPKMKAQFPELAPNLIANVFSFQPDARTAIAAEFDAQLSNAVANPASIRYCGQFWTDVNRVYWSSLEHTNYPLALHVMESLREVAGKDREVDFGEQEQLQLAFAYMAVERWQAALDIFASFHGRPIQANNGGPWGPAFHVILTDEMANQCLNKLGRSGDDAVKRLDFGQPVLSLGRFGTFACDQDGLWIARGRQLLRLDFEMRTNMSIALPPVESLSFTALATTLSTIWIGTKGDGLIQIDKATKKCHRLSEEDGLLMNDIASLGISDDTLWIGYEGVTGGGLGKLDLQSMKVTSFTPSLTDASAGYEMPPGSAVNPVVASVDGGVYFLKSAAVRKFHARQGRWETLPNEPDTCVICFTADPQRVVLGLSADQVQVELSIHSKTPAASNAITTRNLVATDTEYRQFVEKIRTNGLHQWASTVRCSSIRPKGELAIQNIHDGHWQHLEDPDALPNPPSTLTLDGDNLWVGGEGSIALVDLKRNQVKTFCHVKATRVDKIQIAGSYVWAQFNEHLYRAPLAALQ